jgi:hypothetical protein
LTAFGSPGDTAPHTPRTGGGQSGAIKATKKTR